MSGIFISYRRDDSGPWAGRINDALASRFGPDHVFLDVDGIRPGEDYRTAIERTIEASDIALVVIGPRWLTVADEQGAPRLEIEGDVHRTEIETVLRSDLLVVPVLVGGAVAPTIADLPTGLGDLSYRNAVAIDDRSFGRDMGALMDSLEQARRPPPKERRKRPPARLAVRAGFAAVALLAVVGAIVALGGGEDEPESVTADPAPTSSTTNSTTTSTSTTTTTTTLPLDEIVLGSRQTPPSSLPVRDTPVRIQRWLSDWIPCLNHTHPDDPTGGFDAAIIGNCAGEELHTWTLDLDQAGWYLIQTGTPDNIRCLTIDLDEPQEPGAAQLLPCESDSELRDPQRWLIVDYSGSVPSIPDWAVEEEGLTLPYGYFTLIPRPFLTSDLCLSTDRDGDPWNGVFLADCRYGQSDPPLWEFNVVEPFTRFDDHAAD